MNESSCLFLCILEFSNYLKTNCILSVHSLTKQIMASVQLCFICFFFQRVFFWFHSITAGFWENTHFAESM